MRLLPARIADKPQYVFHPLRAARRMMYRFGNREGQKRLEQLPWGLGLEVYTSDAIGFSIATGGVFDPCVTETLHRLIDPGDDVVDVGANVGYMTSLAAVRVGRAGRVLAFEPHPRVFHLLEQNAARWRSAGTTGKLELHRLALSDKAGEGTLVAGPWFDVNMGLAALGPHGSARDDADSFTVRLGRLDEIAGSRRLGLLKLDVEGHEPEVMRGASELLASGRVRDIVFEDHDPYPSEATAIVEAAGYELISLENDLFGLKLVPPADRGEVAAWPGPSYLATRDLSRAVSRLEPRGWRVGGIGPSLWPK